MFKNSLRPVNGLPPEILSGVLEYRSSGKDLVVATHVCKYWRFSLISSPTLWTCLQVYKGISRTLTYLERAKSVVPLDIEMDLQLAQSDALFRPITPHVGRVRSLTIYGTVDCVQAVLSRMFCNPAPYLQHLEIKGRRGEDHGPGGVISLPDKFLDQHTPALRSIDLKNIFLTFGPHFPLHNITRFKFDLSRHAGPLRISTLFRVLSSSPQLRGVFIKHTHLRIIEDVVPRSVVSLESLEELRYRGDSAAQILPWMRLPSLRKLYVVSRAPTLADLLPFENHLLLSKTTGMVYSCSKQNSRMAVLRGSGITIKIVGEDANPIDGFSDMPPVSFGRIEHLAFSHFLRNPFSYTVELPIAAFENLEVLQFNGCAVYFVDLISRALCPRGGEGIPCCSLREIRCDSQRVLESLVWFVKKRELVGNRVQLVHSSDAETLE